MKHNAEAAATLDNCDISRQNPAEEKADLHTQLAQITRQIGQEQKKIKMCRDIDLENIRFHDLRHTYATFFMFLPPFSYNRPTFSNYLYYFH